MSAMHSRNRKRSLQENRVLPKLVTVSVTCWICGFTGSVLSGPPAPKNLIAPPETATETSLTLLWDPPIDDERGLSYEVSCDGVRAGTTSKTFYTVTGLRPGANRYSGWEMETFASLINAGERAHDGPYNVTNLSIRGEGTISGGGSALGNAMLNAEGYYSRARLICLMNCRDVNIQGVTLKNSPSWTLHYTYCKNVTCHGLTIVSEGIRNGDGIDPDSSADSYIFDCNISTSDDCIAIKSGKNPEGNRIAKPTENVLIAHCKFRGHGMSIGSEMSGGVRNVTVRDCEIAKDDLNGLQIKAPRERGGYVRNIRVLNCTLSQIKIITKIRYNTDYEPAPEPPFVGDMEFANLNMENGVTGKPAITIDGYEGAEKNTANIHFKDIRMAAGSTVAVQNCTGISFRNVLTQDGEKPNYTITNAESVDH